MQIAIRKLIRPLRMADFAPEYGDDFFTVWVNPPRAQLEAYREIRGQNDALLKRLGELAKAKANGGLSELEEGEAQKLGLQMRDCSDRVYAWFAEIWSQGPDPSTHSTGQDVRDLAVRCEREDPALWLFLCTQTWHLINDHRDQAKKGRATS